MTASLGRPTVSPLDPLCRSTPSRYEGRGRSYAFSVVSQLHFHRAPKACRWLQALINHWPATLTPAVGFHVRGHPESVERPAMTAFKRSPGPASHFPFQVFYRSAFEPNPNVSPWTFHLALWAEYPSARHPISRECYSDQVQSDGLEACLWPDASLEDFCCPGTTDSPSRDGASLGLADSRDHCGLGFEIPGAGEEMWRDSLFDGVEWWSLQELEIPEENNELIMEPIISSSRSISVSANEVSSVSPSAGAEEGCRDGLQSTPPGLIPALKNTASVKEWLCGYPNCGRKFTHRYMLNKHQKYHIKLHCCLEPSCLAGRVTFSREQDLIRHQSQHNGRRFYCPHANCFYAINGARDGFTRKDNLKRHLTSQHRHSQQS